MGVEIERKFLVQEPLPPLECGKRILQSYLFHKQGKEIRVRQLNNKAYLTFKVKINTLCREEFEFPIPFEDSQRLIEITAAFPPIVKMRYEVEYKGFLCEIDVFEGNNQGLVLAELELKSSDEKFPLPPWAYKEVTNNPRYSNSFLQKYPFKEQQANRED